MTSDPAERLAEHVDGWRKARAMAREMGVKASYTDECVDRLLLEIDRLTQERDEARRSAEECAFIRSEHEELQPVSEEALAAERAKVDATMDTVFGPLPSVDDVERAREPKYTMHDMDIAQALFTRNERTAIGWSDRADIAAALTAARREERQLHALAAMPVTPSSGLHCLRTKNPCGTDTWAKDTECGCVHCQRWLGRQDGIAQGRAELRALDEAVIEAARAVDTAWIEFSEHGNHNARLIIALYARLDDLHTALAAPKKPARNDPAG